MKITPEVLKWPQIDMAFRYIYDNDLYDNDKQKFILEFGTGQGNSTKKICDYLKDNDMTDVWIVTFDSFEGLPEEDKSVEVFSKYTKGAYKLNKQYPKEYVKDKCDYTRLVVVQSPFDQLETAEYPEFWGQSFHELSKNALFIHVDCDLFISTYQALDWCFKHNLIVENTLIAFDEFWSTDTTGGEGDAFCQLCDKYNADFESVFYYYYFDKDTGQKITQEVYKIIKISS